MQTIVELTTNLHCSKEQRDAFNRLRGGCSQWKFFQLLLDSCEPHRDNLRFPVSRIIGTPAAIRVLSVDVDRVRSMFPNLRPHQALELLLQSLEREAIAS